MAHKRGHQHLLNATEFSVCHGVVSLKGLVVPRDRNSLTYVPTSLEVGPPAEVSVLPQQWDASPGSLW